ncbi:MAG: VCBS repeat-containing protein [Phycisphaerales bacterium]|jgi:hypothetical protein
MNRMQPLAATAAVMCLAGVVVGQICDPRASFDKPIAFEAPDRSFDLVLGDLNNDGIPDAVVSETEFDMIEVLLGDGSGSFGPAASFQIDAQPRWVTLGDLNGDENLDVVVACTLADTVSVLLGDGDGTLTHLGNFATAGLPSVVTLGDVDGDGDLDVIVANFDAMGLDVLKNTGDGSLGAPQTTAGAGSTDSISLGDLDGDGDLDVATVSGSQLYVSINDGTGAFGSYRLLPVPSFFTDAGIADMDGDGDLDIVGIESDDIMERDAAFVFRNAGDATFDATETKLPGLGDSLELRDMDGDGDADLVTADMDIVQVTLNQGDGSLAPAGRYGWNLSFFRSTSQVFALALGDVDADGDADAVTVQSRTGVGSVLANRGDGTLVGPSRIAVEMPSYNPFADLAVVDLDNDGFRDVVVATYDYGWPQAFFYEEREAYKAAPSIDRMEVRSKIEHADFNGDGLTDLIAFGSFAVNVLINRGDRTFDVQPVLRVNSDLVATGDVNGDGLADVVASNGRLINVLLGDGAGGLSEFVAINFPLNGRDMLLADVDRNGTLDLLMATVKNVYVLLNDGTGTFAEPTFVVEIDDPVAMALGDVDGNGLEDLAVFQSYEVVVMLATGAGGFTLDRRYPITTEPGLPVPGSVSGTIADVNGDSDRDLVWPGEDGQTLVMLNNGDGRFSAPQVLYADPLNSTQIAVADMNNDGTNDVVTTGVYLIQSDELEVTILLNRCRPAECPADLDGDGELTVYDFLTFLNLFESGSTRADFDGDGVLTVFDLLPFQNEFDAGCP